MIQPHTDGCTLTLRVHPGARRNAVIGIHDGALKVSLIAPPTDGRANEALIAFLAEELNIPRGRVVLLHGLTSRSKTIRILGMTTAEATARLIPSC